MLVSFKKLFVAELKVEEVETGCTRQSSCLVLLVCHPFYVPGYDVLLITHVWEFCQKGRVSGFFCYSVSLVAQRFKWDANVVYSAWHEAVRENWALQTKRK